MIFLLCPYVVNVNRSTIQQLTNRQTNKCDISINVFFLNLLITVCVYGIQYLSQVVCLDFDVKVHLLFLLL